MKLDKYFHLYGDKDGVTVHFEEISAEELPIIEKQTDSDLAEFLLAKVKDFESVAIRVKHKTENLDRLIDYIHRVIKNAENGTFTVKKQTNTAELPPKYGKDDLIHRETARRIIDSPRNKEQMLMMLASIPKVENYAGWVAIDDEPCEDWECSHCGFQIYGVEEPYRFCPNCGKKMWK